METGFKVLDGMTKMPITVPSSMSVGECARTMVKHNVGSLLVVDNGQLKGILTEGDLTYRVIAKNLSPDTVVAKDVMTADLITMSPDMDIYDAIVQMNNFDVRHAPVLHNGKLVGFLTQKDILKIQPDLFEVIVDKYHVREENEKPIYGDIKLIE
ncbi:MAG TPA: CBS domain-containing protein [Acidobacteriota bacterium]|nr:CBS domain-containing protein [Acidobacteriota bacterium]